MRACGAACERPTCRNAHGIEKAKGMAGTWTFEGTLVMTRRETVKLQNQGVTVISV